MSRRITLLALGAAAVLAACSERTSPDLIQEPSDPALGTASHRVAAAHAARERLARRLALALANPAFRARLKRELDRSPVRERKLHLQRVLTASNGQGVRDLARLSTERDAAVELDLRTATPLEVYLPVPAHRAAWRGDGRLLVATAHADREPPVAFTPAGKRMVLDPAKPPDTPVLAVVPLESEFDGLRPGTNLPVGQPTPPPPSPGTPQPPAGLYMTRAHFTETFEGWLKGDPEFEVHLLGQMASTDSLTSYSCAGENAGGWYRFNQDGLDWSGSVLLATQAQLTAYRTMHPGQNMRVFVVEDDDTSCRIKADVKRFGTLIRSIETAYPRLTGGRDSSSTLQRWWRRADALQKLIRAVASFITTNDELVGNAVESAVTGEVYPGANWVVKGENNRTNGWINLVMR
jgi:hypothetical protein